MSDRRRKSGADEAGASDGASQERIGSVGQREADRPGRGVYGAKLLFEFCVFIGGRPAARRLCEERIVVVRATSAADAAHAAQRRGRAGQTRYRNPLGQRVAFRFVGVMDLIELGVGCEPDEVWWAFTTRVRPMERRNQIIPRTSELKVKDDLEHHPEFLRRIAKARADIAAGRGVKLEDVPS